MSALVGLKTDSWDLTKGKIELVDAWPMMYSPGPMAMVLAVYLLFVLKVGPTYMEKRSPYQLKWTLVLYNVAQVLFSLFIAAKCMLVIMRNGLVHSECLMNEHDTQIEVADITWWYFVAKVSEFLDTVFFVLRKKSAQVTFLHIYHHSVMMAGTWMLLKYGPTDHVIFLGFLNSSVHVVMYSYYGLAALGPEYAKYIWWKKYLTRIQLTQFCLIIVHLIVQGFRNQCHVSRWTTYLCVANTTSILLLFSHFYAQSYLAKKTDSDNRRKTGTQKTEKKETSHFNLIRSDSNEEKQIQFVTAAIVLYARVAVSDCPLHRSVYYFFMFTIFMFFYLFADFYRKEFFIKNTSSPGNRTKDSISRSSDEVKLNNKTDNANRGNCQR